MKGSIRKRKNNAWSYRIDLGYVDGKRRQVEKSGFKTEREATKAMQDVLYHLNNTGDYVENKKVSFHTVYEEFIEREGKATRVYTTLMSTEQVPNFCSEPESPEDMRAFSKERAESCGDSAPERTWRSHGPQSPAALR